MGLKRDCSVHGSGPDVEIDRRDRRTADAPIALPRARPYAQAGEGYVVLAVDLRIHG